MDGVLKMLKLRYACVLLFSYLPLFDTLYVYIHRRIHRERERDCGFTSCFPFRFGMFEIVSHPHTQSNGTVLVYFVQRHICIVCIGVPEYFGTNGNFALTIDVQVIDKRRKSKEEEEVPVEGKKNTPNTNIYVYIGIRIKQTNIAYSI